MKQYTKPFAEIILLQGADVLTLSGEDDFVQYDDEGHAHQGWF